MPRGPAGNGRPAGAFGRADNERIADNISVLIVDDHWVVRHGLRLYLAGEPDIVVVGEAANGQEAVGKARELEPSIVLMDLLMPEMDGVEATTAIKKAQPEVEVIALTSVVDDRSVVEAVRAGAAGYVLKDARGPELLESIRAAAAGRVYFSPEAASRLVQQIRLPYPPEPLTERETEILGLVAEGLANKEIARRLSIAEKTVKTHLTNIFQKLGVQSRVQAALHAIRTGLASTTGQRSS
jgi:DNA-binding NarL/FixJ family response regulator